LSTIARRLVDSAHLRHGCRNEHAGALAKCTEGESGSRAPDSPVSGAEELLLETTASADERPGTFMLVDSGPHERPDQTENTMTKLDILWANTRRLER
jgi:hypothetical protein